MMGYQLCLRFVTRKDSPDGGFVMASRRRTRKEVIRFQTPINDTLQEVYEQTEKHRKDERDGRLELIEELV